MPDSSEEKIRAFRQSYVEHCLEEMQGKYIIYGEANMPDTVYVVMSSAAGSLPVIANPMVFCFTEEDARYNCENFAKIDRENGFADYFEYTVVPVPRGPHA